MIVNYSDRNTISPGQRNKLVRQQSVATCAMLTPSSRTMDDQDAACCAKEISLLDALSIEPLDDEILPDRSCASKIRSKIISSTEKRDDPRRNLATTSPLRQVARKLSWSNMEIPIHPSLLPEEAKNTNSSPRKRRPTSPSRKPKQRTNDTSSPRKRMPKKCASFNDSRPSIASPEPVKDVTTTRHRSPLQRLAKQFSLTTLRNLSPVKNRANKSMKKQASMVNLSSTGITLRPKKNRAERSLKKQASVINAVKPKKNKKIGHPISLSKHLSERNLSSEAPEESSFAESSAFSRAHVSNRRRCLSKHNSSSRSFRPPSARNLRTPSMRSLCSATETSAVDTSTPEAALRAEEQVRACSPIRAHRDPMKSRSTHATQLLQDSQSEHSWQLSPQKQIKSLYNSKVPEHTTPQSLKISSYHGKISAPLRNRSSSLSPKRASRDGHGELTTFRSRHNSPKRHNTCNKHSDINFRSNSPLRNSCHGRKKVGLSPKTKRSTLSQSLHESPRKIRDMKHPPQTKDNRKLNIRHGPTSNVVAPMTPTSLRKKYDSLASLADEYDKIVTISLD